MEYIDFDLKKIDKMTNSEYGNIKRGLASVKFSDFATFVQKVSGNKFYKNGKQIYKWELYASGCRNNNYKNYLENNNIKTIENE